MMRRAGGGGRRGNALEPNRENRTVDNNNIDKTCNRHHNRSLILRANPSQWVGKFHMQDLKESSQKP